MESEVIRHRKELVAVCDCGNKTLYEDVERQAEMFKFEKQEKKHKRVIIVCLINMFLGSFIFISGAMSDGLDFSSGIIIGLLIGGILVVMLLAFVMHQNSMNLIKNIPTKKHPIKVVQIQHEVKVNYVD